MKIKVYNQTGQQIQEEADLPDKMFAIPKVKPELVHFVASALLSNMRNTVASTKTRGEVRGGGRKPWKQKGTGRARHGSIRSPLWRGGGVVFGPRPERNFKKKINKKIKRLGFFSVLTDLARENKLLILDDLQAENAKTKSLISSFKNLERVVSGRKSLIILPKKQEDIARAAKNLSYVKVALANNLNLLELLWADRVVILKDALPVIAKTYLKESSE